MPRRPQPELGKGDIFETLIMGIRKQARDPNVYGYSPHEKQLAFHRSTKKKKLYIGGNRSGKTHGGVVEDIWRLKGEHPYRNVPPAPVRGRALCVDFRQGIEEILIPKFKQLMPPSLLKNGSWEQSYNNQEKKLTCANGSTLEFMTYEQSVESMAGTSRNFIHYDEEPPLPIYNECQARLIDTNGDSYMTMTPLLGMTWVFNDIYEPGIGGEHPLIDVITVDITDNPHLNPEAVQDYLDSISDPEERKARKEGKFINLGGLVYRSFHRDSHVIPFDDTLLEEIRKYEIYTSMDHGFNAPTAWLWHAVAADGSVVTFAEHYESGMTIDEHVMAIKEKERYLGIISDRVVNRIGDPAIAQRQGVTGTSIQTEYAIREIGISLGNNDVATGVAKVQQYLKINPSTGAPYWRISENCTNLIREIGKLRWATYSSAKVRADSNPQEKIHKKDDHACDSARYFFSFMPDLSYTIEKPNSGLPINTAIETYDQVLNKMLATEDEVETKWSYTTDEVSSLEYEY